MLNLISSRSKFKWDLIVIYDKNEVIHHQLSAVVSSIEIILWKTVVIKILYDVWLKSLLSSLWFLIQFHCVAH